MVKILLYYLSIVKKERRYFSIFFSFIFAIFIILFAYSKQFYLCSHEGLIGSLLAAVAIFSGFYFNSLIFIFTAQNLKVLREFKKKYYPNENTPFRIEKSILTFYDYLFLSLIYIVTIGLVDTFIIIISLFLCFMCPTSVNNEIYGENFIEIAISYILMFIISFLSIYFSLESFSVLRKIFSTLFIASKEED